MENQIRFKPSFLIVVIGLLALSFPNMLFAGPSAHKYGQFRDLCGVVGEKDSCGDQLVESDTNTIPISMHFQAGSGEYEPWPNGGETIHSGVGYIEPLGEATYSCGWGYPEEALADKPDFMNVNSWKDSYNVGLFCVYTMENGDSIWAYDGIMGGLRESGWDGIDGNKMDALLNVVVGGTGDYEGATGIWVGHTEGWGEMSYVNTIYPPFLPPGASMDIELPEALFKILNGYIKIQ